MMPRKVLVIGPSGSGKTYISAKLRDLGINAVDADLLEGLSGWFDALGNKVECPDDADKDFLDTHEFLWDKGFLKDYLDSGKNVYLFGLSGNVFEMVDLFDKTYFLEVEPEVLRRNLRQETRKNPMGKTDYQLENALEYASEIKREAIRLEIPFIQPSNLSLEKILEILNS